MTHIQITQATVAPDVIDLGIGHPDLSILPLSLMQQAARHRLEQEDSSFLQYGLEQGDGYFRLALARFLNENNHGPVEAEQLFITSGASQALDLICTLFTRPGDIIFVEEPTYFLALRVFADHKLHVVSVPTDKDGLIIEALEAQLRKQKPVFLYTIPTFQNPTSATLPLERRQRLVELSQQHGFLIVADEVYHLLGYKDTPPPTLGSWTEGGTVLSLGSFSKILAPGIRLGWVQTAPPLIERLIGSGLLESGGGLNPFTSALVRSVIELGWQREYLNQLASIYRQRIAVMSRTLRKHMPDWVTYQEPGGGFFFWISLSEDMDAAQLLMKAERDYRVRFQPGIKFSSTGAFRKYLRLSFTFYDEAKLQEGVQQLAQAVQTYRP